MALVEKQNSRLADLSLGREDSLAKSFCFKDNELWSEFKCSSKSIKRRGYHSSVIYNEELYVYGGYDINSGIMSDFHKINVTQNNSLWIQLVKDGESYPGPRHGHVSVVHDDRMYVFGGKISSMSSTNEMNVYDFESGKWVKIQVGGTQPPNIDSHSAVVHEGKMYVFGGFLSVDKGSYSNDIYAFDLEKGEWEKIEVASSRSPSPRANSSLTVVNNNLYIFGGTNLDQKFKDLWKFNIPTKRWEEINTKQSSSQTPDRRAGHSLTAYQQKLVLFGGIQNITHQKDDIFVFDVDTETWTQVENVDTRLSQFQALNNDENQLVISTNRIHDYKASSGKLKKSINKVTNNFSQLDKSFQKESKSQLISKFEIRKHQLLSEFQLTPQQHQKFRNPSPTLESLKNSISSINPPKKKQSEEGGVKQALKKSIRKKPCARDGHSASLFNNQIVFLGGDRHMMSFNDMYLLKLDALI